jgi:hypothetical protein
MKRRRHRVDPFTETLVDQLRQILVAQQVIVVRPIRIGPQLSDVRQPVIAHLLVVRHLLAVGRLLVVQVVRRIRIGPQLSDVRQRVIAAPLHLVVLVVLVIRIAHHLDVRHFPNALHLIARAAPKFMNQIFRPTLPAMNWIAASHVNCQR